MNEYEIYQKGQEYSKRQIRMAKIDKIPVDVYLKYVKDGNEFLETCMSPISNFMEIGNKETKYANETFKFRNGSTLERTLDFLNKGEGFTRLEALGYHIPEKGYISNFGIQVHEQSYQMSEGSSLLKTDSVNYANMASSNYGGRPVIIEGEIPSQYVFQQQNQHEFAIPKDYYDRITSATIKDANTGDILYTYKNGQLTNLIKETKDTNQIVNQVKNILTPPNWENEGKNESLNKEYKALLDKYFGSYIDGLNDSKYTDAAILKFATKDEGYQASFNIFGVGKLEDKTSGKKNIGLNLIKNNENVILEIHGSKEGKVEYGNYTYKINELIQRLEDTGLIPEGTKQIYTMSCYGGLQEKGLTASGIPFESFHTSLEPTIGYSNSDDIDDINNKLKESFQNDIDFDKSKLKEYTERLEKSKEELNTLKNKHPDWTNFIQTAESDVKRNQKQVDFYKKSLTENEKRLQERINIITKSNNRRFTLVNLTESGNATDKYKQDVLDSFKKYGDDFAKAEFIAEPKEIENALWYLVSQKEHERKLKSIEFYEESIKKHKEYTYSAKDNIAFYEEMLQKAKESNNTEKIKNYTEGIIDNKKAIKEYEENIKKYSTIVYEKKLLLQEVDEKDKLYGKDYKAKSNFPKKLTPQEAFDKYGPDDDRFYTSQGLDPKEQRAKINELNSKRKPVVSDEEILKQLHKETEEAAEQFYNTAEEIKNSLDNISNQLEDIKSESKEKPTIKTDTTKTVTNYEKDYKAIRYHNNTNDTINYDISNLINYLTGDYDHATYGLETHYHPGGRKTGTWISEETYTPLIDMGWMNLAELETHGETTLLRTSEYLSKGEGKEFRREANYVTEFNFNRNARILTVKNDDDLKYLKDNYLIKLDRIPDEYDKSIQHIRLDWNRIQNDYDVFQVRVNDFSNASEELLDFTWGVHGGFNNEGFIIHPENAIESYKTYERENFEYNINPSQYKEYKYNKENKEFELIYDGSNKNDIKELKPELEQTDKIDSDEILEDNAKEIKEQEIKNTEKVIAESEVVNTTSKLENRTIQDTAKKSLNTKKLGIAIAGATIAVAGITAMASSSKKKKDKEEYINKINNINTNTNNSYIDYSNDLQYANQITSYSRGHSTYSL